MKSQIKEIYKCDFCNKLYQIKNACIKHEATCSNNPINDRLCFHCFNLTKLDTEVENPYSESEGRKVDLFYCTAKNVFLHTPKTEAKGNKFYTEECENVPMPKDCEIYKKIQSVIYR